MRPNRTVFALVVLLVGALTFGACSESDEHDDDDDSSNPTAPSSTPTTNPTPTPTPTPTQVAYVQDVKPILTADCVSCHSPGHASAGVDLSTYQAVLRTVVAGNANSTLVLTTRSGGSMNRYLTGDRTARAEVIRQWVVNGAPESR